MDTYQRRFIIRSDPDTQPPRIYGLPKIHKADPPLRPIVSCVNTILQQAQPPTPNIMKEQQEALKSLKEDNSIMVLPADKGRASVILDTDTYHAKMSALIDSRPHQLLNKDLTDRLTRKLSEKLLTLKRNGHISETVYNKIRSRHKQPQIGRAHV